MIAVAFVLFAFAVWKYNSNNSQNTSTYSRIKRFEPIPINNLKGFPKKNTTKRKGSTATEGFDLSRVARQFTSLR